MNRYCHMGLLIQQYDTSKWACVQCDCCIYWCCWVIGFFRSNAKYFDKTLHLPGLLALLQSKFGSVWFLVLPKAKIFIETLWMRLNKIERGLCKLSWKVERTPWPVHEVPTEVLWRGLRYYLPIWVIYFFY